MKKLSLQFTAAVLSLSLVGFSHLEVAADDPAKSKKVAEPKSSKAPDQSAVDAMVAQLEHAQLTKREEARRNLLDAGKVAIPALAKAALSGKRGIIEKSIDILARLAQSKDEATREAAKVTLEMLSESDQPSTADRAKMVLSSKPANDIQPFNGGDQFNQQFGGNSRSVSVGNVNGRRTVTVRENGTGTTIEELANGKLHVTITGGKEPIELLVKDLDELKDKCPEAHKIFELHAGNGTPNFGNAFGNMQGFANVGGNVGPGVGGDASAMLIQQLEDLKQRFAGNAAMQQMLDQQIKSIQPAANR